MGRKIALAIVGTLTLTACSGSLEGDGDVVTETRSVSDFDAIHADNGVQVSLTVDSTATGDPDLSVTTDSNLQEFLSAKVTGSTLTISSNRSGGVRPSGAFDVSSTVDFITDVSVDNGARLDVTGSLSDVTLSADNGAQLDGDTLEAATVVVDANNGAQISVCATETVSGKVRNGARVTVRCGGDVGSVTTSGGGRVSSAP